MKVAQSCLTFWDPMDCPWNSPGKNTGVGSLSLLQGSSQPKARTQVSHVASEFFTSWTTREAHTEWSQSEREKQILYMNAYTRNLERWYRWTYSRGSKGDTDTKNRLFTGGEGEGGKTWESSIGTCTLPVVKQTVRGNLLYDAGNPERCSVTTERGGMGSGRWEGSLRGRGRGYVSLWLTHVDAWQKPSLYCKVIILQLKIKLN